MSEVNFSSVLMIFLILGGKLEKQGELHTPQSVVTWSSQ